jgi:hypothetical protein
VSGAPGDRLVRAGVVLSVVGISLALVALLPLVTDLRLPSTFWALSMLVGVGFALILAGLVRNGRSRARAQVGARVTD